MKQFGKALSIILSAALVLAFVQIDTLCTPQEAAAASPDPTVTVTRAATGKLTLKKDAKYKLAAKATAGKLSYKSSKPKVVTVTKKGVLKAKKVGKATITVTAKAGEKKATKKVKVTVVAKKKFKNVKKLTATAGATKLQVGKTTKIKVDVAPKKASNKNVTYKSSSTAVLTVDAYGKVTAKKAGSAKVTVTSCDNAKAKATVTIKVGKPASGGSASGGTSSSSNTPPEPATPMLANLYASPQDFVAGSEDATSLFTVEASGINTVSLAAGERTFAMNDEGANGDETAGDGIWSATVDFTDLAAGESVECRATAGDGLQTDSLTVTAFPAWSEELEAQSEEQTQVACDAISEAITPHVDDDTGYIETEEAFNAAQADLEQALQGLVEDGTAISYEMAFVGGSVKLASGPRCICSLPIEGLQAADDEIRVEFWNPDITDQALTEDINLGRHLVGENVTCRAIVEQMPQNSLIWWYGHGGCSPAVGPYLILSEKYAHAATDFGFDWEDTVSDRVCELLLDPSKTGLEASGICAAVGPGFFDKYKPDMSGNIFIASVCCGAMDSRLADAMKRCGCKGYFGFTDSVDTRYDNPFSSTLVNCLMEGETLGAAFSFSTSKWGANQYMFFDKTSDNLHAFIYATEKNKCAPKVIYGGNYSLKGKTPVAPLSPFANRAIPARVMNDVASVSFGSNHYAVIKTDGSLWMWGWNEYGEIGDGTLDLRLSPVKVMDDVAAVSLGEYCSAAIKADGSLWTWGTDELARIARETSGDYSYFPVKVMDHVAAISLGYYHGAAIKTDGTLWMWGYGVDTTDSDTFPVKVMDNVAAVSLGRFHSAAIKTDGSLWMWGSNEYGRLGDGTTDDHSSPIKIMDDVTSVALNEYHSAAIKTDGSLWMWGADGCGQLGDGRPDLERSSPFRVMENVKAVSLGLNCSYAIKTDGSLWGWGDNYRDELGNPTYDYTYTPIKIMDNTVAVSSRINYTAAIKTDGSLWTWGNADRDSY